MIQFASNAQGMILLVVQTVYIDYRYTHHTILYQKQLSTVQKRSPPFIMFQILRWRYIKLIFSCCVTFKVHQFQSFLTKSLLLIKQGLFQIQWKLQSKRISAVHCTEVGFASFFVRWIYNNRFYSPDILRMLQKFETVFQIF